jgi:hypothetical protein
MCRGGGTKVEGGVLFTVGGPLDKKLRSNKALISWNCKNYDRVPVGGNGVTIYNDYPAFQPPQSIRPPTTHNHRFAQLQ